MRIKNIACNLIYNNGDEDIYVGFKRRCDIQNIIYNVEYDTGRWCSQSQCSCRQFYNRGFKGDVLEFPCNESALFAKWKWNPGFEFKTGKPFRILNSGANKIAVLTTRFAHSPESERKIIGFLKIKSILNDHEVVGAEKQSLRLSKEEALELNFWNYHRNSKSSAPVWRQGRFRYLEDLQVAAILHDLRDIVQNETTQSMITNIIETDFPEYSMSRPMVNGALNEKVVMRTLLRRKYGKGGESLEHKRLKEYIANHPETILVDKTEVKAYLEHPYLSGDLVDILFVPQQKGVNNIVVEIELDNVEPGIHQVIKYRTLRCAQLGFALNDERVKAVVVAWKFKESEKKLCRKYDIAFFEIKI